ncbi:MAG: DUF1214 domain-containing protein [Caulobacteraceae bacterium]|nr:DUF1214 domain-containing protein [Caulobacteraceae bacterium]
MPADRDEALEAAWETFCEEVRDAGRRVLRSDVVQPDLDHAEGLRFLTRLLRYGLEAGLEFSDPDFPGFYKPSHETLKVMSDNPDTLHFMAPIRSEATYRLEGLRGTVARIMFTTLGREPDGTTLVLQTALASDDLTVGPDGRFAITLSQTRPPSGDWLPLKPGANSLLIRAIFLDRRKETEPTAAIRRIGGEGPAYPVPLTAQTTAGKLVAAARIAAGTAQRMSDYREACHARGWINQLGEDPSLWTAGDPGARYHHGAWRIEPDEALVIDVRPPACDFWNFQVNNHWVESLDYRHHPIHVNKATAVAAADGAVRIIVAHDDHGAPNWLHTTGHRSGMMLARWIGADRMPEMRTRLVKLRDAAELPRPSPEQENPA